MTDAEDKRGKGPCGADLPSPSPSPSPPAPGLSFVLNDAGARLTLPKSGVALDLAWRERTDAQELLDVRALLLRRISLHLTFTEGILSIRAGSASDVDMERADQYLREIRKAERALWTTCHAALTLMLDAPAYVDLLAALPEPSDALIYLTVAAFGHVGLTDAEVENLRRGVLDAFGIRQAEDGSIPTCSCAAMHSYGPCPAWEPFAWNPKVRRVWHDWRDARAGCRPRMLALAHLLGFELIERIVAELAAAGKRLPGERVKGTANATRPRADLEPAPEMEPEMEPVETEGE